MVTRYKAKDPIIVAFASILRSQNQIDHRNDTNKHYYCYISTKGQEDILDVTNIILHELKDVSKGQVNIVDIGSGDGMFINMVSFLIWQKRKKDTEYTIKNRTPLDIRTYGIEVQKKILNTYVDTIFNDAFSMVNFPYNFIYMYNPIAKTDLMAKLLEHVMNYMREGSVIIFKCADYSLNQRLLDWNYKVNEKGNTRIFIYKKPTNAEQNSQKTQKGNKRKAQDKCLPTS